MKGYALGICPLCYGPLNHVHQEEQVKKRYVFEITGSVEVLAESEDAAFAEVAYYYPNDYTYTDARLVDVKDV